MGKLKLIFPCEHYCRLRFSHLLVLKITIFNSIIKKHSAKAILSVADKYKIIQYSSRIKQISVILVK